MPEVPVFAENITGAALDGVRIGCVTAATIVELDVRLSEKQRAMILEGIDQARAWLDMARGQLSIENATSVHVVGGTTRGGIIIPG